MLNLCQGKKEEAGQGGVAKKEKGWGPEEEDLGAKRKGTFAKKKRKKVKDVYKGR